MTDDDDNDPVELDQNGTPILSKLARILPDFILDPIYDAIFGEFVRRGNIVFEEDSTDHDRN